MRIILVLAVCGCIVATIALTWISITVAKNRRNANNDDDDNMLNDASTLASSIDSFMVLSVFDICLFCKFCRCVMIMCQLNVLFLCVIVCAIFKLLILI